MMLTRNKTLKKNQRKLMMRKHWKGKDCENSGLHCELCSWSPAKTKKGLITHNRKKNIQTFYKTTRICSTATTVI